MESEAGYSFMRPSLKFCQFAVLRPTRQNRRDPNFFFAISDFLLFFFRFPRTPIVRRKQTSNASSDFQNNQCTPRFKRHVVYSNQCQSD